MALIAIQDLLPNAKKELAYSAASASDTFAPTDVDSKLIFHFKNLNAAPRTAIFDDINSVIPVGGTTFDPNVPCVIDATDETFFVLTQLGRFKSAATGLITVTFAAFADLTYAISRLP